MNLYPEKEPNSGRIDLIAERDDTGLFTYNKRSSAYSDTRRSDPPRHIPCKSVDVCSAMDRGSIAIAKSKGDIAHPCCVPLDSKKYGERSELVRTHACGDE